MKILLSRFNISSNKFSIVTVRVQFIKFHMLSTISSISLPNPSYKPGDKTISPYENSKHISIDPKLEKSCYSLIISGVTPRPVAFISSISKEGISNIAPFSYFGVMSHDPPTVTIGLCLKNGIKKDTLNNIEDNGEFVVNIVSEWLAESATYTCGNFPPNVNEFKESGLTEVPSVLIKPSRCLESAINMECIITNKQELINDNGDHTTTIITGRIVMFHVNEEILIIDKNTGIKSINNELLKPLGRLGGDTWCKLGERFDIPRPKV